MVNREELSYLHCLKSLLDQILKYSVIAISTLHKSYLERKDNVNIIISISDGKLCAMMVKTILSLIIQKLNTEQGRLVWAKNLKVKFSAMICRRLNNIIGMESFVQVAKNMLKIQYDSNKGPLTKHKFS